MRGVNDQQALMIGIRCERGSHRFFKKYGERFEDSEGKQIFLEFADEERAHLDLLVREYRALSSARAARAAPVAARARAAAPAPAPVTPSTSRLEGSVPSHGRGDEVEISTSTPPPPTDGSRRASSSTRAAACHVMAVTDHDTTAALADVQAFARAHGDRSGQRHRDHRRR